MFLLSAEEADTDGYGFVDDGSRIAFYNGDESDWLLHSSSPEDTGPGIVNWVGWVMLRTTAIRARCGLLST